MQDLIKRCMDYMPTEDILHSLLAAEQDTATANPEEGPGRSLRRKLDTSNRRCLIEYFEN
ncbi:MAG UNVERIFIED_CONTAM: hypothetical protein LVQ98_08925 [Rickettsiaceae bacterium]